MDVAGAVTAGAAGLAAVLAGTLLRSRTYIAVPPGTRFVMPRTRLWALIAPAVSDVSPDSSTGTARSQAPGAAD
jgi:hypothetical protein